MNLRIEPTLPRPATATASGAPPVPLVLVAKSPRGVEVARLPLGVLPIQVGRVPPAHVVVPDPRVSRSHAEVLFVGGRYEIHDLSSSNGTFVNGQRVDVSPIAPGDHVKVGDSTLTVQVVPVPDPDSEECRTVHDLDLLTADLRAAGAGDGTGPLKAAVPPEDERLASLWEASAAMARATDQVSLFAAVRGALERAFSPAFPSIVVRDPAGGFPEADAIVMRAVEEKQAVAAGMDMAAPLLFNGEPVAVARASFLKSGPGFRERHRRLLAAIADHAGAALETLARVDGFRRRTGDLERENEDFLELLAHGLRDPIAAIFGLTGLARATLAGGDVESLDEDLAVVEAAAREVARLLTDVIHLATLERDAAGIDLAEVDAAAVIDGAAAFAEVLAARRGVEVGTAVDAGLAFHADRKALEIALSGVVAAVVKCTRRGGSVVIEAHRRGEESIEVSIAAESRPAGAPAPSESGPGDPGRPVPPAALGLRIARRLLALQGGTIASEAFGRDGARVVVELRARPAALEA